MRDCEVEKLLAFYAETDENGVSNLEKTKNAKVIRRVSTTDKTKSYEEGSAEIGELPLGIVTENGKVIGFGIHIFNEDVYPLQSFEIYLRGCDLTGTLDLRESRDMVFLDLYNNRIERITLGELPAMRILGVQNNRLTALDPSGMPACQGIDAGKNRLACLDVSRNSELVELYINDNAFTEIDLSRNAKLKYFYCHNNQIAELDTTNNPLLRHLNATGNPLREIRSLAPQRDEKLPLTLKASGGGFVGLKFNPIYNAQWKETGEWEQSYYAEPQEGWRFLGWFDEQGKQISTERIWTDEYGTSRMLAAKFERNEQKG